VRSAGLGACRPGDQDGQLAVSLWLADSLAADLLPANPAVGVAGDPTIEKRMTQG